MRTLSSICGLLLSIILQAQSDWSFNQITTDDGLSTGTVNCVFKDSNGFIWIGTADGLNRYDGYELTIFKNDSENPEGSISGNIITTIAEDVNGDIWIGTRHGGVNIFNWEDETFSTLNDVPGILAGQIRAIHKTINNQMLIGNEGGGLILYDMATSSHTQYLSNPDDPNSLSDNTVLSIEKVNDKEYWITSLATVIDRFNVETGTFTKIPYNPDFEPAENNRKIILQDTEGFLWLGTDGKGLVKINVNTNEQKLFTINNSGIQSNIITAIYERNGLLYIGTDGKGINVMDPQTETFSYIQSNLLDPNSLSSDAIFQIYEDDSGVIWISTFRGGVNTYSPYRTKFKLYKQMPYENNSLSFASVIDVLATEDGYVWIGTDGGGLDCLDPKTGQFRHYTHDPEDPFSLSTNVAIALEEDANGYIWVGTYSGGVNRLDPNTGRSRRYLPDPNDPSSINSKNVWHILEDSRGTIWMGLLSGGLDKYDPATESFIHFEADGNPGSISSNLIFTMLEDQRGNFWIGTDDKGLNLFDRDAETFTPFQNDPSDTSSLCSNNILTLFEDTNEQLWVGTSEGANIMNTQTMEITRAKMNALLPNLFINGIQEDGEGNLWVSTKEGLSKYNPKDHSIQNYGKTDGLQGNEFNYTSSTKSSDGTMYFGGIKGLNSFKPSEIKMSPFQPNIVLTDIKLFDQSITEAQHTNGTKFMVKSIQALEQLTLRHDQNVLELGFSSLDFTSPNSNLYRYRLDGFDKTWVYTHAGKRTASYTNLDPGEYTFLVEGTNSDGIWSSNSRQLLISVLPAWWESWWFRTLGLVTILALTFYTIRWRSRTNRHQREELQKQVEEVTSRMRAQNHELQEEQEKLESAIKETNYVVTEAVESGNFSERIDLNDKTGSWRNLGDSVNTLFDAIVLPLNRIAEIVGAMASSNLSLRYNREAKGDILKLTSSLDHALNSLSDLIATIKQTTTVVGHLSEEMNTTSKEMLVGISEIASSTSELSNGAQEQVSRIDESSNQLENIREFSSTVGEQAQSINQAAKRGMSLSTSGKGEIQSMDESMQKMEQASTDTGSSIADLLEKSSEISNILNSIKEISVETNMLALNAAIEAAKAGESGRGFAVVADQIRRLAESSNSFTSEIEAIVNDVQVSVNTVNKRVNEMNHDIKESVSASQNASNSFTELASSYEETFNISEKIVMLTDQQFEKVKEVVQVMESVVVIAEEAAAGTEQIASSANELTSGMTEYQERTDKVTQIIKLLNDKMNQFKLNEE